MLVVDDHEVVHLGLRMLLARQDWSSRCLSARSGGEAMAMVRRYRPDVALVDVFLGQESGVDVCRELRREHPELRVVLMLGSGALSPSAVAASGACGLVLKAASARDIADSLRAVALGGRVHTPFAAQGDATFLSPREREILAAMAGGCTNREIAERLHLSPHTVKQHSQSIFRKLGVRNRTEAASAAHRLGYVA